MNQMGSTWYNLDSMLPAPAVVGDTYLGLLLKELMDQNYSVFVAVGDLPDAMAGSMVSPTPSDPSNGEDAELQAALAASMMDVGGADPDPDPDPDPGAGAGAAGRDASSGGFTGAGNMLGSADAPIDVDASGEEAELAAAIAMSMQSGHAATDPAAMAVEPPEAVKGVVASGANPDKEELRRRRLLRFE